MKTKVSNMRWNKWIVLICSILLVGILVILFGNISDYMYIANDDLFMRAIISGDFSGEPDAHAVFILYPLSFFLSRLYAWIPSVEWYGIVFLTLHALCWILIIYRVISQMKNKKSQLYAMILATSFLLIVDMNRLIMQQFTTLSGVLAFTALVYFVTEKEEEYKFYCVEIILMTLSFMVRYEMLLMYLPFFFLTMLFCFLRKNKEMRKKYIKRIILFLGTLLFVLGTIFAIHKSAYSSEEWKNYTEYNVLRSKIYDYLGVPPYTDENIDFYDKIDIEEEEVYLLQSINISMDEKIDTEILREISDYRTEYLNSMKSFSINVRNLLAAYIGTLFPKRWYTIILFFAYGGLIALGIWKNDSLLKLEVLALFSLRSALWIYLIYGGRLLERITYPLVLAEIAILFACYLITFSEWERKKNQKIYYLMESIQSIFVVIMILLLALNVVNSNISENQRIKNSHRWGSTLFEYVNENTENYYILEVMSTSQMVISMFGDETKHPYNLLYAGGWISQLPLEKEKTNSSIGVSKEKALLMHENVYFIQSDKYDYMWLEKYLQTLDEDSILTINDSIDMINENYIVFEVEH